MFADISLENGGARAEASDYGQMLSVIFKKGVRRHMNPQPLAEAIVKLRGAVLPYEDRAHFYVAEAPVTAGLNPLLLVIEDPGGTREFQNVLAVLPAWKIHADPCDSIFYKSALGRVRAKYNPTINALQPANLGVTLPANAVDGRHCGNSLPYWLAKPLDLLIDDARLCEASPRLIAEVEDLLRCRADNDSDVVPWNVLHLHSDRPDATVDADWYILEGSG